jgi:hypothetical protein
MSSCITRYDHCHISYLLYYSTLSHGQWQLWLSRRAYLRNVTLKNSMPLTKQLFGINIKHSVYWKLVVDTIM